MSNDWVKDIEDMHKHYGVHQWIMEKVKEDDKESLRKFIAFRLDFLQEELDETRAALADRDPEEVVDGLIDLCVIAIGTLDAFGCDAYGAWDEVLNANMAKQVGVKESRPNPLGLPDLIKPADWKGPDHTGYEGFLDVALLEERSLKW